MNGDGAVLEGGAGAEGFENLHHEPGVAEIRYAAEHAGFIRQQGGGEDGEGGIFAAADGDFAVERHAAFDRKTVHRKRGLNQKCVRPPINTDIY